MRRVSKRGKRIILLCISVVFVLLQCMCVSASPASGEEFDAARPGNISLVFPADFTGMKFTVIQVGAPSGKGTFEMLPEFAKAGVTLSQMESAADWKEAALACLACVKEDNLTGVSETVTEPGGMGLVFKDVQPGVYLIFHEEEKEDRYRCEAFLTMLPNWNEEENIWNYEVEASLKAEDRTETPPKPGPPKPEPPKPEQPKTAKTGDSASGRMWGAAAIAAAGTALGAVVWRKKRRNL